MAETEARHAQQTKQLVAELDQSRQRLLVAAQEFEFYQKRDRVRMMASSEYGPPVPADAGERK